MAHRDADNEMHAAELLGRSLYEHPEMPWEYHIDMARQLWDEVRHAVLYQKYLERLGGALGDYPSIGATTPTGSASTSRTGCTTCTCAARSWACPT